jgi:hypothetical protein
MEEVNEPIKLLPCPFCGKEAEIERYGNPRQSTIYACTWCGCHLETGEEWNHGMQWNKRAMIDAPLTIDGQPTGMQNDLHPQENVPGEST